MKKKYYLEVIRILAILMVMYNHWYAKVRCLCFSWYPEHCCLEKMKVGKICFKKEFCA